MLIKLHNSVSNFVSFTVKSRKKIACNRYRDMFDNRDKLNKNYRDMLKTLIARTPLGEMSMGQC